MTEPYEYLQRIREDGYATALEYVDNVYSVVESQNLTRFDSDEYNPDAERDENADNTENNEEECNYAHTVGDVVTISGVHYTSMDENCMTPGYTEGTITFIANGARNPYLVDNGNLGWVNDDDVVSCSEHSSEDSDRLTPQQIAYEICFGDNRWGDYPDRKEKLEEEGYSYREVQDYINAYMGQ